jgi:hypothetical protein
VRVNLFAGRFSILEAYFHVSGILETSKYSLSAAAVDPIYGFSATILPFSSTRIVSSE